MYFIAHLSFIFALVAEFWILVQVYKLLVQSPAGLVIFLDSLDCFRRDFIFSVMQGWKGYLEHCNFLNICHCCCFRLISEQKCVINATILYTVSLMFCNCSFSNKAIQETRKKWLGRQTRQKERSRKKMDFSIKISFGI